MRVLIATAVESERRAVTRASGAGTPAVVPLPFGGDLHRIRLGGGPRSPGRPAGAKRTAADAAEPAGARPESGGAEPTDRPAGATGQPAGRQAGVVADVVVVGVGSAAAAAVVGSVLAVADEPYDLVVSAGIGGGFAERVPVGGLVVASSVLVVDLGAQTGTGFSDVAELGFGVVVHQPPPELAAAVAAATGGVLAPVLSVSTVTGTEERRAELAARHRGAAAEAMEGFAVATAADLHGVPTLEIRAVSNAVGPRDREAWRIPDALDALAAAFAAVGPVIEDWHQQRHQREPS
ncbi:futalosine hydrolase [Streptomyces millisiae]|uniref:Futalosine hydrolase n=1 Tax=Streptomyces millisiae TaxID=3075542 RepID=A0ABU2LRZ1_9ACTN|nr:futalosine hydrolase [Streptomyces sp. DSM 44918]MDT0320311.1 futalosine hydrolase [Streptomyces sp. DSM 44918]